MKTPYGYSLNESQEICINQEQAQTVKNIYVLYLQGKSLGGITEHLQENQIPSPSGNETWSRAAIDKMLSNKKYIPAIIPFEQFVAVQFEKDKRSNLQDNNTRKTARYNSQNVLSGFLICAGCGANYRRITRGNGEIVWRCGRRVEHGNKICETSPTISDKVVKAQLCKELEMSDFDPEMVRESINHVFVESDSRMTSTHKKVSSMNYSGFLI